MMSTPRPHPKHVTLSELLVWAIPLRLALGDFSAIPKPMKIGQGQFARKSFTLIELLVVIAIITVLAAMLLPALNSTRERARRTLCLNNLHQFSLAIASYTDDYDGWLPGTSALHSGDQQNSIPYMLDPVGKSSSWGTLYAEGYQPLADGYYCPSVLGVQDSSDFLYGVNLGQPYWDHLGTNFTVSGRRSWVTYCYWGNSKRNGKFPAPRRIIDDPALVTMTDSMAYHQNVPGWWMVNHPRSGGGYLRPQTEGYAPPEYGAIQLLDGSVSGTVYKSSYFSTANRRHRVLNLISWWW